MFFSVPVQMIATGGKKKQTRVRIQNQNVVFLLVKNNDCGLPYVVGESTHVLPVFGDKAAQTKARISNPAFSSTVLGTSPYNFAFDRRHVEGVVHNFCLTYILFEQ